jgi:acyl carrier protein
MSDSIEQTLRARLSKEGFPAPGDDTPLTQSGFVASLELLELVNFIEDTFGVQLEPHDIRPENVDTIARLAGMIRARKGAHADAAH